jgi:hypothetical protein
LRTRLTWRAWKSTGNLSRLKRMTSYINRPNAQNKTLDLLTVRVEKYLSNLNKIKANPTTVDMTSTLKCCMFQLQLYLKKMVSLSHKHMQLAHDFLITAASIFIEGDKRWCLNNEMQLTLHPFYYI